MEYLIACDLEGIHGVVGEPYKGLLTNIPDYQVAIRNAEKEINIVAKALFDCGATKVALWDNHGAANNIDPSNIDKRVLQLKLIPGKPRYELVKAHNFKAILYLGYHSREGTLNGVLAHTFSSSDIQYIKIDGKAVGELEIDSYICALHGIAPIFAASDDICIKQFKELAPEAVSVITKFGKGRNAAEFIDEDEVLDALYKGTCEAVKKDLPTIPLEVPVEVEIRYTRSERAEIKLELAKELGVQAKYGEDTHVLVFTIDKINYVPFFI